jgi:uncharacterized repeat protein (TIGR01451 family)
MRTIFPRKSGIARRLIGGLSAFLFVTMAAGILKADVLEGQSVGNGNWIQGQLQGWQEMDYVPTRVRFQGGGAGKVITINFEHTKGISPAIELLSGFTPSINVVVTSGPTLVARPGVDMWSYTLTVNVLGTNWGTVEFWPRLSAGAHLIQSTLLACSGQTLLIVRPAALAGSPDLAIVETGPTTVASGSTNAYTLHYINNSEYNATGAQVTEILPAEVAYVPEATSPSPLVMGNTLTWDLGQLAPGTQGAISWKTIVNANVTPGQTFNDSAMILGAETDANPADNTNGVRTTIVADDRPPTISANPVGTIGSSGNPILLSVAAEGSTKTASPLLTPARAPSPFHQPPTRMRVGMTRS